MIITTIKSYWGAASYTAKNRHKPKIITMPEESSIELLKSSYPYKLGLIIGNCRSAIIELEVFLELRENILSKGDYKYLEDTINGLKNAINKANN